MEAVSAIEIEPNLTRHLKIYLTHTCMLYIRLRRLVAESAGRYVALAVAQVSHEPIAQAVEHRTFNPGVLGSSPRWLTNTVDKENGFLPFSCF